MLYQTSSESIDPILTMAQVRAIVTYSHSQIYRLIKANQFPAQVRLGPGRVGWRQSAISRWLSQCEDRNGKQ